MPFVNREFLIKTFRRWHLRFGKAVGYQFSTNSIIVLATFVILCLQIILYTAFSSTFIYCRLPNLRSFRLSSNCQTQDNENLPTIYVVTPTYDRHVQKAELIRLSHTFMLIPNLHWIIIEDSNWPTDTVTNLIQRLRNDFEFRAITHLQESTPKRFKLKPGEPYWKQPKGLWQRNKALKWMEDNLIDLDHDGVIYFADDDNTYDLELFNQMRYTEKVSVWPVAFAGGLLVEKPIVELDKVKSFNSMWHPERPFPIDMAGFAISMKMFMGNPHVRFPIDQRIGYVESNFLSQFIESWRELEPKAERCTKVLVWHTRAQAPNLHEEKKLSKPSHSDMIW